ADLGQHGGGRDDRHWQGVAPQKGVDQGGLALVELPEDHDAEGAVLQRGADLAQPLCRLSATGGAQRLLKSMDIVADLCHVIHSTSGRPSEHSVRLAARTCRRRRVWGSQSGYTVCGARPWRDKRV